MIGKTNFALLLTVIVVCFISFLTPTACLTIQGVPSTKPKMNQLLPQGSERLEASGVRSTVETRQYDKPSVFEFSQSIRDHQNQSPLAGAPIRTEGEINIKVSDRPASERCIWVETEIHSHDLSLVQIVSNDNGITITNPSKAELTDPQSSEDDITITINVTIYISRNLRLSSFYLETASLSIDIPTGIPLAPHTPIHISAPSTSLKFHSPTPLPPFIIHALSTTLTATSGSIHGDFRLSDSLSIHTTSGSISINLSLIPSKTNTTTTPATLDVKSASSSIKILTTNLVRAEPIPNRDYRSTISSSSGSVAASLVHGSSTTIRSDSGRIHAHLYPHGNTTTLLRSDISTTSSSGSTEIHVHPSLTNATTPLRNFFADLNSLSGSLRVAYPAQWEGTVKGSTVSGGITVAWPGLRVVRDERSAGEHRLEAVKGDGKGVLRFQVVSGSVRLRGEKEEEAVVVVDRPGREEEKDGGMETEGGGGGEERQVVLTPQSEAGDEWMAVQ